MNTQIDQMAQGSGFIAALDQSGGSTPKALLRYGVSESAYTDDASMFDQVHAMRTRIMANEAFNRPRILGAILFEGTMQRNVHGVPSSRYLWDEKSILPFLKIDLGLADEENGVQMMKPIVNLKERLAEAKSLGVFGTKMRSVIKNPNSEGIEKVAHQQFDIAQEIIDCDLVPIVEPEIDIDASGKAECEAILREHLREGLARLSEGSRIVFKLTLPEIDNFYQEFTVHPRVLRVAALSGGYSQDESNRKLTSNVDMIASFSRALTEHLRVDQTDDEFSSALDNAIQGIADASSN